MSREQKFSIEGGKVTEDTVSCSGKQEIYERNTDSGGSLAKQASDTWDVGNCIYSYRLFVETIERQMNLSTFTCLHANV